MLAGVGDRLIWTLDDNNLANITLSAEDLVSNKVSFIHTLSSLSKRDKAGTDKFLRSSRDFELLQLSYLAWLSVFLFPM